MKSALYTGSFDPLTYGHIDLIRRAASVFNMVYVGVGHNPNKKYLFTKAERIAHITKVFANDDGLWRVKVIEIPDNRLTADIAYELNAVIIKGVRINADFDYERMIHDVSHAHQYGLDTLILPAQPGLNHISSSAAKQVCTLNGNTHEFVPLFIKAEMEKRLVKQVRIGITGSIGAGKSTITKELVNYCQSIGQEVHDIDIDAIAVDMIYNRPEPIYVELREQIKQLLELPDLARGRIGNVIFNQKDKRIAYNKLVIHPLLTRIRATIQDKQGILLFNFALLAEGNMLPLINNNIAVLDVTPEQQQFRLAKRGYNAEQISRRIDSQMSFNEKVGVIHASIKKEGSGMQYFCETTSTPAECAVNIYRNLVELVK